MLIDFSKHLKLTQLRLIIAISELGQLGAAAESMSITQPAASRMLADIERVIGTKVFVRHAKGMSLTEVGMTIARRAHNSLAELNALSREVDMLKQGGVGMTRIGAVTGAAVGYVIPAVQKVRKLAPHAEFDIDVDSSVGLVNSLLDGLNDFVLARVPRSHDFNEFDIYPARTESVKLMVREGHPLTQEGMVSLKALSQYEWVMQSHKAPIREAVEAALLAAGAELPNSIINTTSLVAIIGLLISSDAIAPMASEVSDLLVEPRVQARLVALPIKEPEIVLAPYYLLQLKHRQLSPLANQLKAFILRELER